MGEEAKFFEDFEIGETLTTDGRTITEEKITTKQRGEVVCVAHQVIFVEERNS